MKLIVLLSVVAFSAGATVRVKPQQNPITQQNTDLFKYSPNDAYSLPADIDDDDHRPPVIFQKESKEAKIQHLENLNSGRGKFKVSLKTENGIELNQAGKLKDEKTFVISGSYTYTGADGKRYRVRYTADEFGYHPITELDVEIPDPKDFAASTNKLNSVGGGLNNKDGSNKKFGSSLNDKSSLNNDKGFQFLKRPIGGGNGVGVGGNGVGAGAGGEFNSDTPLASSSNTVLNQKGHGYFVESTSSGEGSGFGTFGSASVQKPVEEAPNKKYTKEEVNAALLALGGGVADARPSVGSLVGNAPQLSGFKSASSATLKASALNGQQFASSSNSKKVTDLSGFKVASSATLNALGLNGQQSAGSTSSFGHLSGSGASSSTLKALALNGPQSAGSTSSFGHLSGSGVSLSGGSFAHGPKSGAHQGSASENVDVFGQIEHHGDDGYNYNPPTNQYLPPTSHPVAHEESSDNTYLPPYRN